MQNHRKTKGARELKLPNKKLFLSTMIKPGNKMIETNLTDGDQSLITQTRFKLALKQTQVIGTRRIHINGVNAQGVNQAGAALPP
jgi:hypothetical protein